MEQIISAVTFVLLGIVGVAFLTALVSNQSNTPSVIGAGAQGFACALMTAINGKQQCGNNIFANIGPGGGGTSTNSDWSIGCPAGYFKDTDGSCKPVPVGRGTN